MKIKYVCFDSVLAIKVTVYTQRIFPFPQVFNDFFHVNVGLLTFISTQPEAPNCPYIVYKMAELSILIRSTIRAPISNVGIN